MRTRDLRAGTLATAVAALALALPASAAPQPRHMIMCSEVNGPPVPGITGGEVTLGGSFGDPGLAGRLWDSYAADFDGKDWDNLTPGSHHEKVVLESGDRKLVLRSRHRTVERDPRNVVTSRGVESAVGKDKAAILAVDDPAYVRRREAFDAIIAECLAEGARNQAKSRAEAPAPRVRAEDYRPASEVKVATQAVVFAVYFAGLLALLSLPWYGSLALTLSLAEKNARSRLGWLAAALVLSPLGWASIDLRNVRFWMIPLSVLAPLLCALLLKALPRGEDEAPRTKAWTWGPRAVILAYAMLSAQGAVQYTAYGMTAGSSEKANLGNLGAVRSALSIYYGDTEGAYPRDLTALMPKYMTELPELKALSRGNIIHLPSRKVKNFPGLQPDDAGGWGYVNERLTPGGSPNPDYGNVFINCTHEDLSQRKRIADY
ncbi:MAG: hypothetical protein HYX59_06585 [Elusimicrobia bacterium]|nr:hypothetical protein [Elusimicrobiota bacterium]